MDVVRSTITTGVLLGVLFSVFLPSLGALAQSQSRGIFVSPNTGVAIGSVWGVFVGVSTYQQAELNLKYAHKDAESLHQFFVTQFQGKIPADHFKVLTNEKASRGNLLRAVKEVLRRAQPEDLVIMSLAMHGLLDTSGQDLYFMTHDADPNFPEDDGISREDIIRQIRSSKARKIVLLLDACHTGAFASSSSLLAMRSADESDINRLLGAMGRAQDGIAVLSSSSAAERSQEGEKFCGGHGSFTCGLLNGLQGAADHNRNGLVELRELYDFTYRAVKTSTDGYQNPSIDGRYDNGLPLAYALGQAEERATPSSQLGNVDAQAPDALAKLRAEFEALKRQLDQQNTEEPLPLVAKVPIPTIPQLDQRKTEEPPPLVVKVPVPSVPQRLGKEIMGQDGAPMRLVPAGEFMMGSQGTKDDEKPVHAVELNAFYMDTYEVTTERYRDFLNATGRAAPRAWTDAIPVNHGRKPVVGVSWSDAEAYCDWAGKRLPTEAEWEKAARGTDGRQYPWGNEAPTKDRANYDGPAGFSYWTLTDVGSQHAGVSPYGMHDMAGNVWEWVADWYDHDYYQRSPKKNPAGPPSGQYKVLRGGSWNDRPILVRSAQRTGNTALLQTNYIGFRCAQEALLDQQKTEEPPPLVVKVPVPSAPHRLGKEITGQDGAPMRLVPAGEFMMGSQGMKDDEKSVHAVELDAFFMDTYEVTTERYRDFLNATGRATPKAWTDTIPVSQGQKPVVGVSWSDAEAYCGWAGKRLPTEAEWEKAARGTDGRQYPWGNEAPTKDRANYNNVCGLFFCLFSYEKLLTSVGSQHAGVSPYGMHDMAGNVSEWVADWYDHDYYQRSPKKNPAGPPIGQYKVLRGGSWNDDRPSFVRSAHRTGNTASLQTNYIGFRCAQGSP